MITGMENTYKASLAAEIQTAIEAYVGYAIAEPHVIPALSEGIAVATIPFLTSNAALVVNAGIAVQVNPSTGTGATTGTGTGTVS